MQFLKTPFADKVEMPMNRNSLPLLENLTADSASSVLSASRNIAWRVALACLACGWLICAGTGMAVLARYESAPGPGALTEPVWPRDAAILRDDTAPTLLMFVHPHCSCSRASLDQLDRIVASCQQRLTTYVVFCVPAGFDETWAKSNLWRAANSIPHVNVLIDRCGVETKRFGARTSGQVLLYDAGGRLRFAGGITASRGHSGDNLGQQQIISIVLGCDDTANLAECSAFGCPLLDEVEE